MTKKDTLDSILEEVRDVYRSLEKTSECPADGLLFDFVTGEVSESNRAVISDHSSRCQRCRMQILKMKSDLAMRKHMLEEEPDAAFARAFGTHGLKELTSTIDSTEAGRHLVPHLKERIVILRKNVTSYIENLTMTPNLAAPTLAESSAGMPGRLHQFSSRIDWPEMVKFGCGPVVVLKAKLVDDLLEIAVRLKGETIQPLDITLEASGFQETQTIGGRRKTAKFVLPFHEAGLYGLSVMPAEQKRSETNNDGIQT